MKVIGTAGHIDHGKSTLVERLTGIDPDRLLEEKRRGMTIDLGFAWLTLPSGAEASIVDVPGHERFIRNMLAGAGGIDIALLIVAADEGVMPQTREHLNILDLLSVTNGVIAVTKTDLVDADVLELASAEVMETISKTTLATSSVIPVSAVTGSGLDTLVTELDRLVLTASTAPTASPPYLPVDRVFTSSGFGTVVTGTLHGGALEVGREVDILPAGHRARVRSMQNHGRAVDAADAGSRLALNLVPVTRDQITRGDTIALPHTLRAATRLDVSLRILPDAPFPLMHGSQVTAHIGSAERNATVTLLGCKALEPGTTGWAQLRLDSPVPATFGQRFIVRLPAPVRTVGGGMVVDVAPRHRRNDLAAVARLNSLLAVDIHERPTVILMDGRARSLENVAQVSGLSASQTTSFLNDATAAGTVVARGRTYMSREGWEQLASQAARDLEAYHQEYPLRLGMPREELRRRIGIPAADWPVTLGLLREQGQVEERGTAIVRPGWIGGSAGQQPAVERLLKALTNSPFTPPAQNDLLAAAAAGLDLLQALVDEGQVVRVADGMYFERGAFAQMVRLTIEVIEREGSVSVARLRDILSTSRKYVLAFLEYLDGERITRRVGDTRVLGSRSGKCA
ncbi:MAG: selenocysteine-specific translation elongation factor [Chloroflexota bacterium]